MMNAEQQYIDLFSQTEAMICKHSAEVLNAPRAAAFADFERIGFPTRKMEKYKYTDVSKYFEPDFGLNLNRLAIPVNPYEVFKCDVPNMSTALYFVVNDAFYNKALPKSHLPEGVIFGSLKDVAGQHPELVKKYYGKLADTSKDGVTAFNTTFAQDGVIFYVPKNVIVEKPIQLVNILRADVNFMVNRRVLIILEDGAQARLLICDHAMDNVNFLATQVIEVFTGENAVFDMYELEETHTSTVRISNLYVKQEANSNVLLNGMTLHNGTTRNTTEVLLYIGIGISFPLLSGFERLTNQRKLKLNLYRLKNEEELEKQQLYTDIEQTLLSLRAGYMEHQQVLQQLSAETQVLKESERKWEEGLISVFQLMEARNRFISAKAELVRVRLQVEMMVKLEKYYREGTFL